LQRTIPLNKPQLEWIQINFKINNALNDNVMKKKITSLALTLLLGLFSWNAAAATGWYEDYVKINVNNAGLTGPTGYYWIGTDPSWATSFVNGLGTVTSLKLDGADMKYWSDTQDRTGGSFFYQVTSADGATTYIAPTEAIWTQSYLSGNNYQGMSSGLNVDLLTGIPAGTACKLTVWAKSWGTGQGDSWLTNSGANYVATFTTASILLTGATGINNTRYTTLKGAFDAINANTSGLNTDEISIKVGDNTTETATAILNPSKGVSTLTTAAGSGYQAPVITINGGTRTVNGNVTTTITNGMITSIVMTGGTWTVAPTSLTIAAPAGGGTTATAIPSLSSSQVVFTITNRGTNYGPTASFSSGGGTGAAVDVIMTTAATAVIGAASPRTVTPATLGLTYSLTCPGSGYTSNPTCAVSSVAGGTGGTVSVASLYPSIEFNQLAIYPTAASKSISGTALSLISIVGRNNVTFDGRVNRTGTPTVGHTDNLTIATTGASNYLIALNSNCQNNTIQYCTLKGSATTAQGIIQFGSATSIANGNGLNVIDRNLITNNGTRPLHSIYSIGNSSFPNASNQITNNEFKDVINSGQSSVVIYALGGHISPHNDNFTISGNSFYLTSTLNNGFNAVRQMITIGTGNTGTFGGSHTITDNYIGGSAANCGGTALTKINTEASFTGIMLYPSPSVTSGGVTATSLQNNTIKNINWANNYYGSNWFAINIGGTGAVNIGTVTGNSIGDNISTGSIIVSNSNFSASATMLNIGTTGTVVCQNNKIGSITASNTTEKLVTSINCIVKTATTGTTTISNNIIGSTTIANSISATCTSAATLTVNQTQSITAISNVGSGTNTISYNTISNITNNLSGTITTPGSYVVTGNCYGISCTGTGTYTVANNTISNITENLASTIVGNLYAINLNGTGAMTGTVNGNLIHSNVITGYSSGSLIGIQSAFGATNIITNNIIKLGDANASHIRGIGDASGANIYHNTVYLSGVPTLGAFTSSSLYCGVTTNRNYKNNILVNTRSNADPASGEHYAFSTSSATTTGINIDGNNYYVNGTNGMLGKIGTGASQNTLPFFTGQDAASINENPIFANAGGTLASDYIASSALLTGVAGTGVTTDYAGINRTAATMGAYFVPTIVPVSGVVNSADLTLSGASQIEVAAGAELTLTNSPSISKIILAPTAKLSMGSNSVNAPNGVILQSDATGTATLTGDLAVSNATVQQYVSSGRNWYISPSVSAAGYTTLNRGTSVVEWNEGTKVWDTKSSGTLDAGRGYIQVATSSPSVTGTTGTVNFTGTTNNGDITTSFSLTRTGELSTSGFNLVGNPYPSYLRWSGINNSVLSDANNTEIGTSFWYRTKNNSDAYIFVTHNGTSGYTIPADQTANTTITGIIPPMQAFWVRVTSSSTTMKFTNVMRLHADNALNKFKAPKVDERKRLRLQLTNGTATDEALIYFDAAASNSFDNYDSPKMLNNSTMIPDLYSKAGNEKLVINGLAEATDNMTLPLGFTLKTAATGLTLKVSELSNFAIGTKVYLLDSDQNTQTELLPETQYTFNTTSATSNNESRFSLLFRAPGATTGVDNANKLNAQVFVNAANQITIIAPEKSNYAIYNAMGQQVTNGVTTSNYQTAKLQTGMYVVKVGNQTTRVIIK